MLASAGSYATTKFLERRIEMAARAILSESAEMHVVPIVAINAATTRGVHRVTATRVTKNTGEFLVCTVNDKARTLVMIKIPDTPITRVVTGIAG